MAWSKKVQLAGHTIAYDPFARVIHSHMRPPEYTRKRGVTQSFFTTEIINSAPPGDFQEVPLPEVLKLEKQVAKDCRLLLKLIRLQTNRSGGVPIGEIRKALRRLHVKISFRKTSRHTTAFVNLRYQPLSMLGIMLLDRAATDEMKLEEIAVLIEKSRAAFDGDLWGNYIAAVRYFRNVLPSPLTDKLRASMVGV